MNTLGNLQEILLQDDAEGLQELLGQGLDPRSWLDAESDKAILSLAIVAGSTDCVELLLEEDGDWAYGAPFDPDLETPLAIAIQRGSGEIVNLFIKANAVDRYSASWLQSVAETLPDRADFCSTSTLAFLEALALRPEPIDSFFSASSLKAVRKRAESCASSRTTDPTSTRWGKFALLLGSARKPLSTVLKEIEDLADSCHTGRIRKLLEPLDAEARSQAAGLALVYAAAAGDWDFAHELVETGADCTVTAAFGTTALMNATRSGNLRLIRELLARGADLHAREKGLGGRNAIEMAPSPLIKRYLEKLDSGASPVD